MDNNTKIKNITFTRGNSYGLQLTLKTNIDNITGINFVVKDSTDKQVIEKTLENGITRSDNVITLRLKPNDTKDLIENIDYKYALNISYGLDDNWTPVKGKFIATWNVEK